MINNEQKKHIRLLCKEIDWSARISSSEIRVGDLHGDFIFDNNEVSYKAVIKMLQQLRQSKLDKEVKDNG